MLQLIFIFHTMGLASKLQEMNQDPYGYIPGGVNPQPQGGYPPQQQQSGYGGYPPQGQQGGYPQQEATLHRARREVWSTRWLSRPTRRILSRRIHSTRSAGRISFSATATASASTTTFFLQILQNAVRQNELGAFYDEQKLEQIASTIGPKLLQISQSWKIPLRLAFDLARLALYDIVLYCDDSGSMRFDEEGERIEDLKVIVSRCAIVGGLLMTMVSRFVS